MSSSLKTGMAAPDARFLPRSSLARWALAFFVVFLLLLDLTPLFRFEAGTQFADIDKVTGPAAWASIIAANTLALLAVVRSKKQALGRILATGLGRGAFTLAAAALVLTIVGPAIGNGDLYLLGGAVAFAAALTGSFASFRASAQRVTFLPRTAIGTWALCIWIAALASIIASPLLPFDADPMLIQIVTELGVLLWAPAAASGLIAVLHYRERSALVLVLTALVATAAVYWAAAEFVFPGH
ncbi:hypothetical protein [Arthrobacter sp. ok909]|uniref:hypothetical protein n=1 Tax=Arthrobacter sp. ok909 TaxID=1761746 RepID=UPI001113D955|nr:hypothetical protein [Arthrobacter sp. ok909]